MICNLRTTLYIRIAQPFPSFLYRPTQSILQVANVNTKPEDKSHLKPLKDIPNSHRNFLSSLYSAYSRRDDFHIFIDELKKEHGPILKGQFGGSSIVYLYDVAAIEKLFRNETKYPNRIDVPLWKMQREEIGEGLGIVMSTGEEWWRIRKCANKVLLNTHKISAVTDDVNNINRDLIDYLKEKRQPDGKIVFDTVIDNWVTEMSWGILYQRRLGCLQDSKPKDAVDAQNSMTTFNQMSQYLMPVPPKLAKTLLKKKYDIATQCMKTMFEIGKESIHEAIESLESNDSKGKGGILTEFVKVSNHAEEKLNEKQIHATVAELMAASLDTTRNTALCLIDEIARSPDIQNRLYKEIALEAPNGEDPNPRMLQNTTLLRACVKESLRLYPITLINARVLQEDTDILGYLVPAETTVFMPLYTISRDENVYHNADKFVPDRWIRDEDGGRKTKINPFAYLPFGHGARSCVGRRLAELELYSMLFKLVQNFVIEPETTEPLRLRSRFFLVPSREIKVTLRDR